MINRTQLKFGSGAMVAAAFVGPGTITTCSLTGANHGYQLLWTLLFSVVATVILQEMVVRLTVTSQKNVATLVTDSFSQKSVKWLVATIVILAIFIGNAAYESGNIAGAALGFETYFGSQNLNVGSLKLNSYGILIGISAALVLLSGSFKLVERLLIALVFVMSIVFIVSAIVSAPSITTVMDGFIPKVPADAEILIIGLVGTTMVPYNLFLQSGAILKQQNTDTNGIHKGNIVSIGIGGIISMSITITSAAVFFQHDLTLGNVSDLAIQLEPLLGNRARLFMSMGFIAAGLSSAITAPLAAAIAVAGVMKWPINLRDKKLMPVWLTVIGLGVFFQSTGIKPLQLITIAQFANGLLLPVLGVILLILVNKKKVLGQQKNSRLQNIIGGIVILVVVLLGLKGLAAVFGLL